MYINSLRLHNIRSFHRSEIKFSRGINIIVGPNNAGKSTILKSIYKLQKGYSLGKEDIRKTTKSGKIAINFTDILEDDKLLFRSKLKNQNFEFSAGDNTAAVLFNIHTDNEIEEGAFVFETNHLPEDLSNVTVRQQNKYGEDISLPEFVSFPDKENQQNYIYPFFAKRKNNNHYHRSTEDTYSVYEDLSNLAAKIMKLSNSSHPQHDEFVRLCDDILNFRVGQIPGDQHENRLGIYVTNSDTIPLQAMGEGVINILGLLVILLTEDNKLFLIEELENDLHPAALKKLLQLIIDKSDRNQFIISTHSNIVVKYLGSEDNSTMLNVNWKPYQALDVKIKVPTSEVVSVPTTSEARMELLECLGYDLFDFEIYSGFLLLEESSAEQIIREILIPQFVPSLVNRIRTIASQGADDLAPKFNDLHRLFLFVHSDPIYKNRAWAIGDGDQAGRDNISKLKETFRSWPSEHFITLKEPAFEYYYPKQFQENLEDILTITNKRERKKEKSELLQRVLSWAKENPKIAKQEFNNTAGEVINVLYKIKDELL